MLGDVGGFNDGLTLLLTIVMGSYSAFAYKMDVLKSVPIDSDSMG